MTNLQYLFNELSKIDYNEEKVISIIKANSIDPDARKDNQRILDWILVNELISFHATTPKRWSQGDMSEERSYEFLKAWINLLKNKWGFDISFGNRVDLIP